MTGTATTASFWLGPGRGRWTPSTWDDLVDAAATGLINETTWIELKRDLPSPQETPRKDANVELARDLAALALRSGVLIVGMAEASRGVAGQVVGVELASTRDRIDQVARTVPDPPIHVETREISDPASPGRGCLLVGVSASGPHMVDARYWGRTDTGKYPLTDPEVREHLARHRFNSTETLQRTHALANRTPRRDSGLARPLPRLFVTAHPTDARDDCLLPLLQDPAAGREFVATMIRDAAKSRPGPSDQVLHEAEQWQPRAGGRRLTSLHPNPAIPQGDDEITIELAEQGEVGLIYTPAGGMTPRTQVGGGQVPTVRMLAVLAAVHDILSLTGHLAATHAAYPGTWSVATHLDTVEGCHDQFIAQRGITAYPPAYTGHPDYDRVTQTTTAELVEQPWEVTSRLLAPLLRALGAEHIYLPYQPGSTAPALAS